jgi:hypothetical protein
MVYAVVDDSLSPTSPLGDVIETLIRPEAAKRFVEEVGGDDPSLRVTCGSRSASSRWAG